MAAFRSAGRPVVLRLVHGQEEARRIERRRTRNLRVELDQFVQLDGRHHLPRDHRAVDHVLGKALGHLRNRHRHADGAQRLQRLAGKTRRRAQLQTLEVVHRLHRLVGVDQTVVMTPVAEQLDVGGLLAEVGVGIFLRGARVGDAAAGGDERQLEHLGRGEAAGGRARQRPDDIDHAVARLIVELRRRAAELHRREDVDLDLAARVLLDHLGPRRQHLGVAVGHRRQEVVQFQRHLRLSERGTSDGWRSKHGAGWRARTCGEIGS